MLLFVGLIDWKVWLRFVCYWLLINCVVWVINMFFEFYSFVSDIELFVFRWSVFVNLFEIVMLLVLYDRLIWVMVVLKLVILLFVNNIVVLFWFLLILILNVLVLWIVVIFLIFVLIVGFVLKIFM